MYSDHSETIKNDLPTLIIQGRSPRKQFSCDFSETCRERVLILCPQYML